MLNIKISKCIHLIIKIFVIGYSSRGESILFLFLDKENSLVLYSIVVDCFKYKGLNKTKEILDQYKIQTLDMLCWSHPDFDHTKDMETLLSCYCGKHTKIITPYGLNGKLYDVIDYNKEDISIVHEIINLNQKKGYHLTSAVTPGLNQPMEYICFSDYPDQIKTQISTLSPFSPDINRHIGSDRKIKKNDLSIALFIEVENYHFLLCSDIEDNTIRQMMNSSFDNPIFIKIPHHTSPTSQALLELLQVDKMNTYGCTTIYKQHKLPNEELLEKYKDHCKTVHSTGTSKAKHINHGIIEYTFDLYDQKSVSAKCHGHAYLVES